MTLDALAARLGRDLAALTADAGWSTTVTTGQAQGHYTDPIADAIEDHDVADLTAADTATVRAVKRSAMLYCLDRLEAHYAAEINISSGGESLSLAGVVANVRALRETLGGFGGQGMKLRSRPRPDFTLREGEDEGEDPVYVYPVYQVN